MSSGSWHYRSRPRPPVTNPVHQRDRCYSTALDAVVESQIAGLIRAGWKQHRSLQDSFALALDDGVFLASLRQWYRIANRIEQDDRPPVARRKNRRRPSVPIVAATGPGQVWMWDITDLPGEFFGVAYKAYSIQDLYSRKIVGFAVHAAEKDGLAVAMFVDAFAAEQGKPAMLHADRGAAMTSNALENLCLDLGITMSFNRPSVSNDNPFKESEFRTLKTRPSYPGYFESLEAAHAWMATYVVWFNAEHHHSALGLHTPNSVHDGSWVQIHQRRVETVAAYYNAHPGRHHRPPKLPTPAAEVGINLHHRPSRPALQKTA